MNADADATPILVSVVVATRNRVESLQRTLRDLLAQDYAPLEVVTVDNGSTDGTRDLVAAIERRGSGARLVYELETQRGKSFALNTGIGLAHGEILAFTDDDVRVPPTWAGVLVAAFRDRSIAGAAGRTLLAGAAIPDWFHPSLLWALGRVDLGDVPRLIQQPVPGMNFAFRREVFERYGLFRTDMGPGAPGSGFNEDSEFLQRVFAGGERVLYLPEAAVRHEIPPSRVTRRALRVRFWREGLSRAPLVGESGCGSRHRARLLRRTVRHALLAVLARGGGRSPDAFRHECEALWRLGLLWRLLRFDRSGRRPVIPRPDPAQRARVGRTT